MGRHRDGHGEAQVHVDVPNEPQEDPLCSLRKAPPSASVLSVSVGGAPPPTGSQRVCGGETAPRLWITVRGWGHSLALLLLGSLLGSLPFLQGNSASSRWASVCEAYTGTLCVWGGPPGFGSQSVGENAPFLSLISDPALIHALYRCLCFNFLPLWGPRI